MFLTTKAGSKDTELVSERDKERDIQADIQTERQTYNY